MTELKIKICSWILKTLLEYTPPCVIRHTLREHLRNAGVKGLANSWERW